MEKLLQTRCFSAFSNAEITDKILQTSLNRLETLNAHMKNLNAINVFENDSV